MARGIPEYDELKLRIDAGDGGVYNVVAFGPDGGTATGRFVSPISDVELDNFILRVARPRARAYHSSQMEEAKQLGEALFERLLAGDVGDVYHGARRVADTQGRGLRIALYMTGAPKLLEVPWELLYDPGEAFFLSQSIYTPVVRSLDLKNPPAPRSVTLPLQVLALVSAPDGLPPLDAAAERANLEHALAPLVDSGAVQLRWLESATLAELDRRIAAWDELHVIHYIGHGAYDERTRGGIIVLEDSRGRPHEVTGEELGGYMRDEKSLRLAVLNTCEGARASHIDPFSGVASSLLRSGLPAVIGMQAEITDEAAITFSDRLYTALAQGFPIDAALAQGRRAIFAGGRDVEFGTPVLFMRVADGRIFDVTEGRPRPPLGRVDSDLHAEPAISAAGGTVTWHLKIRNIGPCPVADVTGRDKSGETRAGPLTLEPGATREYTWAVRVDHSVDECVTVGGRSTDGRLVNTQVSANVSVNGTARDGGRPGGGRPTPSLLIGGAVAALVAVVAVALAATGAFDGDESSAPAKTRVFHVGAAVDDLDARGEKVAFVSPAEDVEQSIIRRLDLTDGPAEGLGPPAFRYKGIDVGINLAGHARLVYSRCKEPDACDLYSEPFRGAEQRLAISTPECTEMRPTMAKGLVLFARGGPACSAPGLWLKPAQSKTLEKVAGTTAGADLNNDRLAWLALNGQLVARSVELDGTTSPDGALEPAGGDNFEAPLVVEGDQLYFVHEQGSRHFIARAPLPLNGSKIEHYSAGKTDSGAGEAPHFAVTADTLYISNYPRPGGKPGSGVILRVYNPKFVPTD